MTKEQIVEDLKKMKKVLRLLWIRDDAEVRNLTDKEIEFIEETIEYN